MKAVLLRPRRGEVTVEDVPPPQLGPGRIQIRNQYSLISTGTERSTVHAARQGLVGKARERPEQAGEVLRSARAVGPLETYRVVADRLSTPTLLGYSCAGTAVGVGEDVRGISVGSLVAAGGGGYASHAEVVSVPSNLCVPVPARVSAAEAAFTTVGAVALQGIHQAEAVPGSRVAVIGLGLVGQLAARLLHAYGYDVVGIDRDPLALEAAGRAGLVVLAREDALGRELTRRWNRAGADAVLVCASTKSSDPIELAGALARDRAAVVIVGDVRVAPPRSSYYGKELSIRYSRSYGPGRYDPKYEQQGVPYPEGYVPWPLRRNMVEFLRLVAAGLDLDSLAPAVVPVEQAAHAYELLDGEGNERRLAILLRYDEADRPAGTAAVRPPDTTVPLRRPRRSVPAGGGGGKVRIAASGAGSFPTRMLFPHLGRLSPVQFSWITTSTGVTAAHRGRRFGFEAAVASLEEGLARGDAHCVLVLGPHAVHAEQVAEVLRRGLPVFCEKPLALDELQLEAVADAWLASGEPAMVGFNRRFAPAVRELKEAMPRKGPVQVMYRVFAGPVRSGHWLLDARQGGRILGEVCHFIDAASYLVDSVPSAVYASSAEPGDDPTMAHSATVHLEFADGSTASIVYAGATPRRAPKERIEVAAGDLAASIDDFRALTVWDSRRRRRRTYRGGAKGHAEEMRALVSLLLGATEPGTDFVRSLWSTLATCRAAQSLRQRERLAIQPATPALVRALAGGGWNREHGLSSVRMPSEVA